MEELTNEPSLRELIDRLTQAIDGYQARLYHYVADLALYGYALDVLEQSIAVDQLKTSRVPRSAYANARAAMESAQDMLLLVANPNDYDMNGCLARAFEVLDVERLHRRKREGDLAIGSDSPTEVMDGETHLINDANSWDGLVPGRGKLLRTALERVQAEPDRQKHWSGMGRKAAAQYLESTIGGEGFAAMLDALYGLVSYHAHPSMRTGGRQVSDLGDGRLTFHHREVDEQAPDHYARLALEFARQALARKP